MCDNCGCSEHKEERKVVKIDVKESLLKKNDEVAAENRAHFDRDGVFCVNLISSPGSGKTTLLERTVEELKKEFTVGVLEGDIETDRDAERIRKKGVTAVQLTTGGACHLEAPLVHRGYHELVRQIGKTPDIVFIENVGNLVCPASFFLGEHLRVVLVSVPEGDDKPAKYPKAFRTSQAFVITKIDLLPYFDFDIEKVKEEALSLNPKLKIFEVSSKTGQGLNDWINFLRSFIKKR